MDFFDDYNWHSSLELGSDIKGKKIVKRITASRKNTNRFIRIARNSDYCIHKSTKQLWKFSEDGKYIEAVFPDDILVEEDL